MKTIILPLQAFGGYINQFFQDMQKSAVYAHIRAAFIHLNILKDFLSIPKSGVEEWVTCQAFQCETNLKLTIITMMVAD